MQLVLGSYAIAMSTVILPTMSHQAAAGKFDEMKHTFGFPADRFLHHDSRGRRADPLRSLSFRCCFNTAICSGSTPLTAHALLFYSLGLPAYAAITDHADVLFDAGYAYARARGRIRTGENVLLNALFLLFSFRYLSNGSPALASSLAAYFNFGLLLLFFRKRYGALGARGVAASLGKMAVCAVAMALVSYAALHAANFSAVRHVMERAGLLGG